MRKSDKLPPAQQNEVYIFAGVKKRRFIESPFRIRSKGTFFLNFDLFEKIATFISPTSQSKRRG